MKLREIRLVLETYIFHIQTYIYEKKDTTIFVDKDENVATTNSDDKDCVQSMIWTNRLTHVRGLELNYICSLVKRGRRVPLCQKQGNCR